MRGFVRPPAGSPELRYVPPRLKDWAVQERYRAYIDERVRPLELGWSIS